MGERNGFSLVELLVALAVFSLAAMALLNLAAENTRTAAHVENRALAAIVAENRAVELLISPAPLEPGVDEGRQTLAGREWRWRRTVSATARPEIMRIDVEAGAEGEAGAHISVFRGAT